MENAIYITYASDNNYVHYMGISMISVMENNKNIDQIIFYILSLGIENNEIFEIKRIVENYGREIHVIDIEPYLERLSLNMPWEISKATYARLFISEILKCDQVIYMDCDTVVVNSLAELWDTPITEYAVAGVRDIGSEQSKIKVGLTEENEYINAGVLLINLRYWREHDIWKRFSKFICEHEGRIHHHDQGVINAVLNNSILVLPPSYNLMTGYITMKVSQIVRHYHIHGPIYEQEDIDRAIEAPVIIHFTPFYTTRPWEKGCMNPKRDEYEKYKALSPWANEKNIKPRGNTYTRILNWTYNHTTYHFFEYVNSFMGGLLSIVRRK